MGAFSKLYNDFSGGIVDEQSTGRFDSAVYQKGAEEMLNVLVNHDGSVEKRKGFIQAFCNIPYGDEIAKYIDVSVSAPTEYYKSAEVFEAAGFPADQYDLSALDSVSAYTLGVMDSAGNTTEYTGLPITSRKDRVTLCNEGTSALNSGLPSGTLEGAVTKSERFYSNSEDKLVKSSTWPTCIPYSGAAYKVLTTVDAPIGDYYFGFKIEDKIGWPDRFPVPSDYNKNNYMDTYDPLNSFAVDCRGRNFARFAIFLIPKSDVDKIATFSPLVSYGKRYTVTVKDRDGNATYGYFKAEDRKPFTVGGVEADPADYGVAELAEMTAKFNEMNPARSTRQVSTQDADGNTVIKTEIVPFEEELAGRDNALLDTPLFCVSGWYGAEKDYLTLHPIKLQLSKSDPSDDAVDSDVFFKYRYSGVPKEVAVTPIAMIDWFDETGNASVSRYPDDQLTLPDGYPTAWRNAIYKDGTTEGALNMYYMQRFHNEKEDMVLAVCALPSNFFFTENNFSSDYDYGAVEWPVIGASATYKAHPSTLNTKYPGKIKEYYTEDYVTYPIRTGLSTMFAIETKGGSLSIVDAGNKKLYSSCLDVGENGYGQGYFSLKNGNTTVVSSDWLAWSKLSVFLKLVKANTYCSETMQVGEDVSGMSLQFWNGAYPVTGTIAFGDDSIVITDKDGAEKTLSGEYARGAITLAFKKTNQDYRERGSQPSDLLRMVKIKSASAPTGKERNLLVCLYLLNGKLTCRVFRLASRAEELEGDASQSLSRKWYDAESGTYTLSDAGIFYDEMSEICVATVGSVLYVTSVKEAPLRVSVSNGDSLVVTAERVELVGGDASAVNFTTMGYPALSWFGNMRWWLGGFPKAAGTIAASRVPSTDGSARYTDFTMYDSETDEASGETFKSVLSSHAIKLTEDIPYLNGETLRWVAHGVRELYGFENVIMMDTGSVPTPETYDLTPTIYGAIGTCQPAVYRNCVFYTGGSNLTINAVSFDLTAGGYLTQSVSDEVSEHIRTAGGVVALTVYDTKEKRLFATLKDGTILCGLIANDFTVAWSEFTLSGMVKGLASAMYESSDRYIYDRLLVGTSDGNYIRLGYLDDADSSEAKYADFYEECDAEDNPPTSLGDGTYFYPKANLKGDGGYFIVDGNPLGLVGTFATKTVEIDGVETEGLVANVKALHSYGLGEPYESRLKTLPIVYDESNGIMLCRKRHLTDILLRVRESGDFTILADDKPESEKGFNAARYDVYNGGERLPLATGNYRIQFVSTVDDFASVALVSDKAYPFNLLAMVVVGKVEDRL